MSKKIGLVLGGGASSGFAHLGVLKVLEENHIPIDIVTGCSMGAIIGGLYATGSEDVYKRQDIENQDGEDVTDDLESANGVRRPGDNAGATVEKAAGDGKAGVSKRRALPPQNAGKGN